MPFVLSLPMLESSIKVERMYHVGEKQFSNNLYIWCDYNDIEYQNKDENQLIWMSRDSRWQCYDYNYDIAKIKTITVLRL